MRRSLPALVLLLISLSSATQAFELEGFDGERVLLDSLVDTAAQTLFVVWSLDCYSCKQEMPLLQMLDQDSDAKVVGIVLDGPTELQAIQSRLDSLAVDFENVLALSDVFYEQFQQRFDQPFRATPTYILFNANELVGVHVGPLGEAEINALSALKPK